MNSESKARAPCRSIDRPQARGEFRRPADADPVASLLPKEKFEQPLGVDEIQLRRRMSVAENSAVMPGHATVRTVEDEDEGPGGPVGRDQRAVSAMPEKGRNEAGIQRGDEAGVDGKHREAGRGSYGQPGPAPMAAPPPSTKRGLPYLAGEDESASNDRS